LPNRKTKCRLLKSGQSWLFSLSMCKWWFAQNFNWLGDNTLFGIFPIAIQMPSWSIGNESSMQNWRSFHTSTQWWSLVRENLWTECASDWDLRPIGLGKQQILAFWDRRLHIYHRSQ
jgi:hypothetical protein